MKKCFPSDGVLAKLSKLFKSAMEHSVPPLLLTGQTHHQQGNKNKRPSKGLLPGIVVYDGWRAGTADFQGKSLVFGGGGLAPIFYREVPRTMARSSLRRRRWSASSSVRCRCHSRSAATWASPGGPASIPSRMALSDKAFAYMGCMGAGAPSCSRPTSSRCLLSWSWSSFRMASRV
jgi:hypothetical protein